MLDYRQAEKRAREALDEYNIRPQAKAASNTPVKLMSGGSQQRSYFPGNIREARLSCVASQPTKGDWISRSHPVCP